MDPFDKTELTFQHCSGNLCEENTTQVSLEHRRPKQYISEAHLSIYKYDYTILKLNLNLN